MSKWSRRSLVSNPITGWSVTRWGSTPRGMQRPQPKKAVGTVRPLERGRARITILFFELHIREPLIKQRAEVIKRIFEAISDQVQHSDPGRRRQATKDLARWQQPSSEHANCARAFYALCQQDLLAAKRHYDAAVDYLETHLNL
jgi:hypothetical protein